MHAQGIIMTVVIVVIVVIIGVGIALWSIRARKSRK